MSNLINAVNALEIQDCSGKPLRYGDWVTIVYSHFTEGEVVGLCDFDDGTGIELVVLVGHVLHNVRGFALQLVRR